MDRPSTSGYGEQPRRPARPAERESLAQILLLVRRGEARTRQEIERVSGLGRAVVADRVTTLMQLGLLTEEGRGPSTGGRAPRQVRFNAEAGYVLVSSLGTTTLGVGLADLSGELLVEHHEPADATRGAEPTMERVAELFDWMLEEHPVARKAWAITFAAPGLVESTGGLGASASLRHMPGWADFDVAGHLNARFGAPVLVANEVHVSALGELRAGRGAGLRDLLFVKVGTGIGAGICVDGHIHGGATGYAGDIGHVAVMEDSGTLCRCGNDGCLEALAGGAAIAREGREAAENGRSPMLADIADAGGKVSAATVGMAAGRGDPFSVELITRSGRLVGQTLATLIAAMNPSLVVIGGGVSQAGSTFIAAIRDGIYGRSRSLATENLTLARSELGKTAALVGGALAAIDDVFQPERLRSWIELGSPRLELPPKGRPEGSAGSSVARSEGVQEQGIGSEVAAVR